MPATASKTLNGAQKSAVLCLALGPDHAAQILRQLGPDELESVTREMSLLPRTDVNTVQQVLNEYESASGVIGRTVHGGVQTARQFLDRALGQGAADSVMGKLEKRGDGGRLAHLERVEPKIFASILQDEHPQTIAVILSHLDLKQASRALLELPSDLASDVLFRMARMEKILPDMLSLLDEGLKSKADLSLTQEMSSPGDAGKVAKLLNLAAGGRDEEILAGIEKRNPELAAKIKALMFVFEDLQLIDNKGIQMVLREVDGKDLALALKGASPELRQHIKSNMSERAAAALIEEIDLLGAVRVRDVEAAQQRIMEGVRQLEEAGEVVVRRETDSGDFIA